MPQMDPRALKATSVKAEDEHANSAEPQALKITAASSNPKMFTLPWHKPLATWPKDLLANLPRGISRHVVRFVHVGDEVYAMKEITRQVAERVRDPASTAEARTANCDPDRCGHRPSHP